MGKPVIGITLDFGQISKGDGSGPSAGEGKYRYILHEAYMESVIKAGGIPVALPLSLSDIRKGLGEMINGLMLTGSGPHIDPAEYGQKPLKEYTTIPRKRYDFEREMLIYARRNSLPILGICGGMQLINVVFGGSLFQDIGSKHMQKESSSKCSHQVVVKQESLLSTILGKTEVSTNSHHTQAVDSVANGFRINSSCLDYGKTVIEGIEAVSDGFTLGVQWHPEELWDDNSGRIFSAFVMEAEKFLSTGNKI